MSRPIESRSEFREKPQSVVRGFPFGLRPIKTIWKDWQSIPDQIEKTPFIEVYWGQKTPTSLPSPGMVTALGGKIEKEESFLEAAFREIYEEATIYPIPFSHQEDKKIICGPRYKYEINNKNYPNPREIIFVIFPVISKSLISPILPRSNEGKIEKILPLTLNELGEAVETGFYQHSPVEGHLTLKPTEDINMPANERIKQQMTFKNLFSKLFNNEKIMREKFASNFLFLLKETPSNEQAFDRLRQILTNNKDNKKLFNLFEQAYWITNEQLVGTFFRKKEILSASKQNQPVETTNFSQPTLRAAYQVKKGLTEDNLGQDILALLPLIANTPNLNDFLKVRTTRFIFSLGRLTSDLISSTLKEESYDNLEDYGRFLSNREILDHIKLDSLIKLNNKLIDFLSSIFNLPEEQVLNAWRTSQAFLPSIGKELRIGDPQLLSLYQFHKLRNEVSNSSLAQTLLLFLGIDTKNHGNEWPRMKFEAANQMIIFLKNLFCMPYYKDQINKMDKNPFNFFINDYFGPVDHSDVIKLNLSNGDTFYIPIEHRKKGKLSVIVDEKPMKSGQSFIRKSFLEKPNEIKDFVSYGIILPDEHHQHLSGQSRILQINKVAKDFLTNIKKQFPSERGWKIQVLEDKNTFDIFNKVKTREKLHTKGKRTGSIGGLIIRRKIYYKAISPEGEDFYCEMAFYPFESLKGNLLGWREKIEDDPFYTARRWLMPISVGLLSLYEYFVPPSFYPETNMLIREKGTIYSYDKKIVV